MRSVSDATCLPAYREEVEFLALPKTAEGLTERPRVDAARVGQNSSVSNHKKTTPADCCLRAFLKEWGLYDNGM